MTLPKSRPSRIRLGPMYHNETQVEYRLRMLRYVLEANLIDIVCERPGGLSRPHCDELIGLIFPVIKKFMEARSTTS